MATSDLREKSCGFRISGPNDGCTLLLALLCFACDPICTATDLVGPGWATTAIGAPLPCLQGWVWVGDGELRPKKRKRARVHVHGDGFRNSDTDRGTEFGLENVVFGFQIETVERQNLTFREITFLPVQSDFGQQPSRRQQQQRPFSGALDVC